MRRLTRRVPLRRACEPSLLLCSNGSAVLNVSSSHFDPQRSSGRIRGTGVTEYLLRITPP